MMTTPNDNNNDTEHSEGNDMMDMMENFDFTIDNEEEPNYEISDDDNNNDDDIYMYRERLDNILFNEMYKLNFEHFNYELIAPEPEYDYDLHNNIQQKLSIINAFRNFENIDRNTVLNSGIITKYDLENALNQIVMLIQYKYLCENYNSFNDYNVDDYDSVNQEEIERMGFIILEILSGNKYQQLTKKNLNKFINKHVITYILDKHIEKMPIGDGPNISKLIMSYV